MVRTKLASQVIDPKDVFEMQNAQYRDVLFLTGAVPANSGGVDFTTQVSNEGHFLCQFITGTFSAVASPVAAIVDTGVTYLSGQLKDGSRNLFSDRIPLDLVLSPGRRRSVASTTVLTDPVGNSLFYPLELEYLFKVNTMITFNVANTSDEINNFEIAFHGWRCVQGAAADAIRAKAKKGLI